MSYCRKTTLALLISLLGISLIAGNTRIMNIGGRKYEVVRGGGFEKAIKILRDLDKDSNNPEEKKRLVELYKKFEMREQVIVKKELERSYFDHIKSQPEHARRLRDLHSELVAIKSEGKELFSYVLGAQQPHATSQIREMHKGVPSQLAANKIMTDMKSDIIKLAPERKHLKRSGLDPAKYDSLAKLAAHPMYKKVLELPYRVIFFWAHGDYSKAKDGLSEEEAEAIYKDFYDFAAYILTHYNNSGKTFMIGNWEGDWLLDAKKVGHKKDCDPTVIQGMIDWYNIRAKAIETAKKDFNHRNVHMHVYIELNHVTISRENRVDRIVNSVLPYIKADYVSVSSYDIQGLGKWKGKRTAEDLRKVLYPNLEYIEDMLPPRDIPGKRVFIGEIGFPLAHIKPPKGKTREQEQARLALVNAIVNLEWGVPFWLWWAVHNNEPGPINGFNGFGIVDQTNGHKTKLYYELEKYYAWADGFTGKYKDANKKLPTNSEFRKAAIAQLKKQLYDLSKQL